MSGWALVDHKAVQGTGNVTTAALDTTGANLLILTFGAFSGAASVSDSKGNTWNALTSNSSSTAMRIYWCIPTSVGSGHTFTATGGAFGTLCAAAFSGAAASSPFDVQNTGVGGVASHQAQPGSVTPSQNNSLIIVGCSPEDSSTGAPTINSSFLTADSLAFASGTAEGGSLFYLDQSVAAAINPTCSWTTGSANGVANIAVFKPTAGGGGGSPAHQFWMLTGAG